MTACFPGQISFTTFSNSDSLSLLIRLTSPIKGFGFVPRRTNVANLLKTKEMMQYLTGRYNISQKSIMQKTYAFF